MLVLIGLGNPGEKYKNNRHNVGFMFIDYFVKHMIHLGALVLEELNHEDKFGAELGRFEYQGEKYVVAKPQTFMNASGDSVQRITSFYQIPLSSLYVAHDDLDIPFGKYKTQFAVGPKLHNGLDSIENRLGEPDFYRIRIGVDNRGEQPISGESYVLQNFTAEEMKLLPDIFAQILAKLPKSSDEF